MNRRDFLKIPLAIVPLLAFPALAKDNNELHGYSVENAKKFRQMVTEKVELFAFIGGKTSRIDPLGERSYFGWKVKLNTGDQYGDIFEIDGDDSDICSIIHTQMDTVDVISHVIRPTEHKVSEIMVRAINDKNIKRNL